MSAADPFATLGIEPRFRIGEPDLRRAWMRLAAGHHPDHEGDAQRSAEVNEAYQRLRDPILRGEALLRRLGATESRDPPLPAAFLASMIEFRERLDEARGSAERILALRSEADAELSGALERVAAAFDAIHSAPVAETDARGIRERLAIARALRRAIENLDAAAGAAGAT